MRKIQKEMGARNREKIPKIKVKKDRQNEKEGKKSKRVKGENERKKE